MASEADEVCVLLSRHRAQIIRDCSESKLIAVLVQKGVLTTAHERVLNEIDANVASTTTTTTTTTATTAADGSHSATIESVAIDVVNEQKCTALIGMIAQSGFEKFKQFCYAIESECPQLIEDLINDRLKNGKFWDEFFFRFLLTVICVCKL